MKYECANEKCDWTGAEPRWTHEYEEGFGVCEVPICPRCAEYAITLPTEDTPDGAGGTI